MSQFAKPLRSKERNKKTGSYDFFPCGKCYACVQRRISGWAFRLDREMIHSRSAYFITLTYDEDHVVSTNNGLLTLHKPDLQQFFKRLRQNEWRIKGNSKPIKYYAIGEYGSRYNRPHYHIILFNAHQDMVLKSWVDTNNKAYGDVHFGDVEQGSIKYVVGYFYKELKVPLFPGDDRQKEFAVMSKGLGKQYLTQPMLTWYGQDILNRFYLPLPGNQKASIPRYYQQKMYSEKLLKEIKQQLIEKVELERNAWIIKNYQQLQPVHVAQESFNLKNKTYRDWET